MAKKKGSAKPTEALDADDFNQLLDDLKEAPALVQRLWADFMRLYKGKQPMTSRPAKCGPDDACADCLDCACNCALQTLVAVTQAKQAHEQDVEAED